MNNKSGDDIEIYWISISGILFIKMQSYAMKIKESIHNQGQHDIIYIYNFLDVLFYLIQISKYYVKLRKKCKTR
jgi:hypothetical protein